jgi:hypothetical protein
VNLGPDPSFWWIKSIVELVEREVFDKKIMDLVLIDLETECVRFISFQFILKREINICLLHGRSELD